VAVVEEAPGGLGMRLGLGGRGQGTWSGGSRMSLAGMFLDEELVTSLKALVHARKCWVHSPL